MSVVILQGIEDIMEIQGVGGRDTSEPALDVSESELDGDRMDPSVPILVALDDLLNGGPTLREVHGLRDPGETRGFVPFPRVRVGADGGLGTGGDIDVYREIRVISTHPTHETLEDRIGVGFLTLLVDHSDVFFRDDLPHSEPTADMDDRLSPRTRLHESQGLGGITEDTLVIISMLGGQGLDDILVLGGRPDDTVGSRVSLGWIMEDSGDVDARMGLDGLGLEADVTIRKEFRDTDIPGAMNHRMNLLGLRVQSLLKDLLLRRRPVVVQNLLIARDLRKRGGADAQDEDIPLVEGPKRP